MGRAPCIDETSRLKKGPWTPEEDEKLTDYIQKHGHGSWRALPKAAGLNRCGKSCRLRWTNYLRPDIKRGRFSEEEEDLIIKLHSVLGNKWSRIAAHLPGRTDNEIKNHWNTHLRKKLLQMGIDPVTHKPRVELNLLANLTQLLSNPTQLNLVPNSLINPNLDFINNALGLQPNFAELAKLQVLQNIIQIISSSNPLPNMGQPAAPLSSYINGLDNNINPSNIMGLNSLGFCQLPNYESFSQEISQSCPKSETKNCNIKSFSSNSTNYNNDYHDALNDNALPSLVSSSPEANSSIIQIESATTSINGGSTRVTSSSDHFFDWEKLLNDRNEDDSLWNDFIN